ncbi:hypothetical protein K443DRAFT_578819 [Laccaria amethystina LaAM-08-1]|uniref:Uncharacterized protein n=1 Tax=Laccaria amethystina LaAM-08-1 TaxID=1095629 RepID=A0A0C9XHS2_9AGAR|nr:hypothetical protein K443DRAFT_578819 [Laccaria amethystina LaAM-08-1]
MLQRLMNGGSQEIQILHERAESSIGILIDGPCQWSAKPSQAAFQKIPLSPFTECCLLYLPIPELVRFILKDPRTYHTTESFKSPEGDLG